MNMETAEKLPKHLKAAVNQLEKQHTKLNGEVNELMAEVKQLEELASVKAQQMKFLKEQIAKLKGEQ